MAAFHPLGLLVGRHPQTAIPWTMAPGTRGGDLIARRAAARRRPGGGAALIVAGTGRLPARRGPRRPAVAAALAKYQRLQPLERDLRLTEHRQQPLIRPQHPLQQPPVLLLPSPRAEPLAQCFDLVQALLDLVGLAHGSHPSLLHVSAAPGMPRSPSDVVLPHYTVNVAHRSLPSEGNHGLLQPQVSHSLFP